MDLCSNPEFLNYYLLTILLPEKQALELKLHQYTHIKLDPASINVELKKKVLLDGEEMLNEESDLNDHIKGSEDSMNNDVATQSAKQELEVTLQSVETLLCFLTWICRLKVK